MLVRKEEMTCNTIDSICMDTTILITNYTYNDFDSLTESITFKKRPDLILEIVIRKYDPETHLKIEETGYEGLNGKKDYTISYRYYEKGRLIERNELRFPYDDPKPVTQHKHTYTYKKDILFMVQEYYHDNYGSWMNEDYYEQDLLTKAIFYIDGKVSESLNYYYTYW